MFAYCSECRAPVTVRSNTCLLGHTVDVSHAIVGRGRHVSHNGRPPRGPRHRPRLRIPALLKTATTEKYGVIELLGMGEEDDDWSPVAVAVEPPPLPPAPEPVLPVDVGPPTELDWGPDSLGSLLRSILGRKRWLILYVVVALIALISLQALTSRPQPGDITVAEEFSAAVDLVSDQLEAIVPVMVTLDQPDESVVRASQLLADLETTSAILSGQAGDEVNPPLDNLLTGLVRLRSTLGDALTYRLLTMQLLEIPDLPTTAKSEEITVLTAALANWTSERRDLLETLPDIEALAEHRTELTDLVDSLEDWVVDYTKALGDESEKGAEKLVKKLDTQRTALIETMSEGLRQIAAEAETLHGEVTQLADELA